MHEVSDIASDPVAWRNGVVQGNRIVLKGVRDGVEIKVVVENGADIVTGHPLNLPRNP